MKPFLLLSLCLFHSFVLSTTNNAFNIQFIFNNVDSSEQATVQKAAARWQELITKGFGSTLTLSSGTQICNQTISQKLVVQDLLVFVSVQPIDGVGGNLARTGPCGFDTSGNVRLSSMEFDSADLPTLLSDNKFPAVALHEMGHALGVGTVWDRKNLLLDDYAVDLILYRGVNGADENGQVGVSGQPKVQPNGGPGIARIHWEKSVYGNELMTPYITGNTQPLSILTAASLIDIG